MKLKNSLRKGVCVMGALLVSACGSAGDEYGESTAALSTVIFTSSSTATVGACNGIEAPVTMAGSFSTNRGLAPVEVTVSIDGGAAQTLDTIIDSDFSHSPGLKTASYSYDVTLGNGHHTLKLCFYQASGGGKTTCETLTADINCVVEESENECADVGFFGVLVSNPNIGGSKGLQGVPVHVRGDLGNAPELTVEGPFGVLFSGTMRRAGESCNYHYLLPKDLPSGAYSCSVTGNGHTYSFEATLQ